MKYIIITSISFLILINLSCKDKGVNPGDNYPPGYQHDIPWPSLADSPWPMNHGNPQNTGRSRFKGPTEGILSARIPAQDMESAVVIGKDSTIYFNSSRPGYLFAVKYNGIVSWSYKLVSVSPTTPLITSDGTVITANGTRQLIAVDKNGNTKWTYTSNNLIFHLGINIDKEGTIYFLDASSTLNAVNKVGQLIWQLTDNRFYTGQASAPSFSPDGKTLYVQGKTVSLLAVDIDSRTVKWTYGNNYLLSSPVIDAQGNIYIIPAVNNKENNIVYSLKPNGTLRWKYELGVIAVYNYLYNMEPTIDKYGNIYLGADTLYSITYDGKLRWKLGFGGFGISSPLISDVEGNIYLGLAKGLYNIKITKVSSNGNILFEVLINDERVMGYSPAISENGLLFFPTFRSNNILVIK
ncbi:MAG: PQQ-binding-like beta-propeller repeat protein [Bacteroidetes bacterium]|nr:PQQ-binding-like beta-propeller repeat protein [Bacteroidota bacterium]